MQLGDARTPQRLHPGQLRILVGCSEKLAHFRCQPLRSALAAILNVELESPGVAQTEDWRRREGEHQPFLDPRSLHEVIADELLCAYALAFVPMFLRDENGRGIVAEPAAEKIKSGESNGEFVGVIGLDGLEHFAHHPVGTLKGSPVGQKYCPDVIALILVGHKTARCDSPKAYRQRHHADEQNQADGATPDDPRSPACVAA